MEKESDRWFYSLVNSFNEESPSLLQLIIFGIKQPASYFQSINADNMGDYLADLKENDDEKFSDIFSFCSALIDWLKTKNKKIAFPAFYLVVENVGILSKKLDEWFLPIMKFFVKKTKRYAVKTNIALNKGGKQNEDCLLKAAEIVRMIFSNFQTLKGTSSMKIILFLLNELFWIYFKYNNYHQCKSFMTTIESKTNSNLTGIPRCEEVTFLYYSGRMHLFESKMKESYFNLSKAYNLCKGYEGKNHEKIKRQILKYLIPVKMFHGEFPHPSLIEKFKLYEYLDLSIAVYKGDLDLFNKQVNGLKRIWIKRGLYFFMEKLNLILLRNLFKLAFTIFYKEKKSFQVDTEIFVKAINWKNSEILSVDEVECIIANLIYKSYIKGYISHEKRKIVLSKKEGEAFPPINEISKK